MRFGRFFNSVVGSVGQWRRSVRYVTKEFGFSALNSALRVRRDTTYDREHDLYAAASDMIHRSAFSQDLEAAAQIMLVVYNNYFPNKMAGSAASESDCKVSDVLNYIVNKKDFFDHFLKGYDADYRLSVIKKYEELCSAGLIDYTLERFGDRSFNNTSGFSTYQF